MVKHTQTIRIDLSVFDHIMGLVLKGLKTYSFTCVIAYITKISTPPPPLKTVTQNYFPSQIVTGKSIPC